MNFLSKDLRKKVAPTIPQASDFVFFPDFQISAGLSGGQKYASLIVTREGELSGNLVNTAARLQARANRISPDLNKILLSSHAYQRVKERVESGALELPYRVGFFNTGLVEFKGVSLPVFEVIFTEREAYRFTYQKQMEQLYLSLRKKLWRGRVFEDALELALVLSKNLPDLEPAERGALQAKVRSTGDLLRDEKFEEAVEQFDSVVRDLGGLKLTDALAVEYLRRVHESYRSILQTFLGALDAEVEEQKEALFNLKERQNLELVGKYQGVLEATRRNARSRIRNQRVTWQRVAEEAAESLDVRIKSLK
jgi:hypothetical protein